MFAYIRMRSGLLRMIEKKKNENPSYDVHNFSHTKASHMTSIRVYPHYKMTIRTFSIQFSHNRCIEPFHA